MSCQDRTAGWEFRCDLIERNQLWHSLWRYASGVELEPYLIWQMKWMYHHITGTVRSPTWISRGLDRVSGTIWLWFNGQGGQIPSDRSWPGSITLRTRDHNSTICSTLVSLCPFSPCTQTGILRKEDPLVTRLPWSQKDNSDRIPNDNASGMIEHREESPLSRILPFFSRKSIGWWNDWHHRIQSWSDHHDRDCYNRIRNHWWNQHLIRDWFSLWMEKNHCWNATVELRSVSYTCCAMEHDPPFCFYLPSLPTSIVENKNDQVFHNHTGKP